MSAWPLLLLLLGQAQSTAAEPGTVEETNESDGYTPPESVDHETLRLTGYVDVGFAAARGNGSSFVPGDTQVPADYAVDAFAPAVNSRGEVASTDSGGRFTNGFLPRSMGIGANPSFMINTVSADVRFAPRGVPLFVFVRAQLMPRWQPGGDATRVELQQAFGRWTPFKNTEFTISAGRFDSVFGIEYLENEANIRAGITPSLIARYTTGHALGLKLFYRVQLPRAWSAFSINVSGTNSGSWVESLVPVDASLVGIPVGNARLGYELNLPSVQVKVGGSGAYGPRNDQYSRSAIQWAAAADARIDCFGVSLAGEFLRQVEARGPLAGKETGLQTGELASAFNVWGGWARLLYAFPISSKVLTGLSASFRYDRRLGQFEGFAQLVTDRFTAGLRAELYGLLAVKVEGLINRELRGAPNVNNDVLTASVVWTW